MGSEPPLPHSDLPPDVPLARPVTLGPDQPPPLLDYAPRPKGRRSRPRLRAIIELVLLLPAGIVAGVATHFAVAALPLADHRWPQVAEGLGTGAGCVLLCFVVLRLGRHEPASIGLTTRRLWSNVGLGLAALLVTYLVLAQVSIAAVLVYPELLAERSAAQQGIERNFPRMPLSTVLMICVWVAIWEETIFRGFVLTRLHVLLRRWWLTVLVASVAFGAFHFYEGVLAVVVVMLLAVVMSTLFVWRRSLVPSMIYHFLHNLVIFQLLQTFSTTWK